METGDRFLVTRNHHEETNFSNALPRIFVLPLLVTVRSLTQSKLLVIRSNTFLYRVLPS
jgi:hypothetical protein